MLEDRFRAPLQENGWSVARHNGDAEDLVCELLLEYVKNHRTIVNIAKSNR